MTAETNGFPAGQDPSELLALRDRLATLDPQVGDYDINRPGAATALHLLAALLGEGSSEITDGQSTFRIERPGGDDDIAVISFRTA